MPGLIRKPGLRAPSPAIMQNSRSPSRFAHFSRDRHAHSSAVIKSTGAYSSSLPGTLHRECRTSDTRHRSVGECRSLDGVCSEILGPGLLGRNDLQIVLFVLRRDGLD
jgi:hypothetical protein